MAALTPKGAIAVVVPMAATTRGEKAPENKGRKKREKGRERESARVSGGHCGPSPAAGRWLGEEDGGGEEWG